MTKKSTLIAIRTPNFIGDTIMTLPALELLKMHYPDVNFVIICPSVNNAIFRHRDDIAKIINDNNRQYKGWKRLRYLWGLTRQLKQLNVDMAICYHNTLRDVLILKLASISPVLGFAKEGTGQFLDFHIPLSRQRHYVNRFCALVNDYWDRPYTRIPTIRLNTDPPLEQYCPKNNTNIGLLFGGNNKGARAYPHGLKVVEQLIQTTNANMIFLGDTEDAKVHHKINNKLRATYPEQQHRLFDSTGKTSVAEFIDLIQAVSIIICLDSAAAHIAAATNTPAVIFIGKGASSFEIVRPLNHHHVILNENLDLIEESNKLPYLPPEVVCQAALALLNDCDFT